MKAILVNVDKSLRWDDVPDPIVDPEDCLVKIEAAALNRADLMQREGDYPPRPDVPNGWDWKFPVRLRASAPKPAENS